MSKLLTSKDLEEWLNVSRHAIIKYRSEGMPFLRVGGSVRFEKEKIQKWIDDQQKSEAK